MVGLHLPTEEFDFVGLNLDLTAVAADLPTSQLDLQPLTHGSSDCLTSDGIESSSSSTEVQVGIGARMLVK
ncbi:unnamed protein product [Urochloa humidicola]